MPNMKCARCQPVLVPDNQPNVPYGKKEESMNIVKSIVSQPLSLETE